FSSQWFDASDSNCPLMPCFLWSWVILSPAQVPFSSRSRTEQRSHHGHVSLFLWSLQTREVCGLSLYLANRFAGMSDRSRCLSGVTTATSLDSRPRSFGVPPRILVWKLGRRRYLDGAARATGTPLRQLHSEAI